MEVMPGSDGPGRKPRVSDEELLAIFRDSDDPVLIAKEVAENVAIGRRAVYDRLGKLEEQGLLESKKLGGRTTVWWLPGHTQNSSSSEESVN